ncbi:TPA: hypothetical protein UN036_000372 [Stenotrophomonas maltophilia]|uniref:DUF3653 domain-containing protein n=1 Tax=Stenotrophomonas maltophilia TaxID=40324 RepID=UPI000B4E334E|nr:DUF3653 domain-containing protein [Stenotrophomonas maltophilia]MBA0314520.1 hypothetical protein [Stenotrophomonas maltophilia]MDZ5784976.1 DUF3653 domain-containing protein [Stenotrophomonas maltophilia]OWQ55852.1 hypothetical protein CEE59_13000 [Stenotrophomonas maltophilia]PZS78783.1 hypothetical protein A7X74_13380 [Stenotrophomonas maltophilia]HEL3242044.1 hypothetical protein [Stenotrophomonas maltophilia]
MIEFDPHHRIDLTGPWAGFSFLGDRLITPEGRELLPEDLAWLSLTACQAQEWRRMMEAARAAPSIDSSRNGCNRDAGIRHHPANVVNLRDVVSQRKQRSAVAMADPDADPVAGVLPVPGPRPRQRV